MDEPCSALDPIATARIEELIHELRGRYAIVIVTHNMQQAARVVAAHRLLPPRPSGRIRRDRRTSSPIPRETADQGLHHRPVRLRSTDMATGHGHTVKAFDDDIGQLRGLICADGRARRGGDRRRDAGAAAAATSTLARAGRAPTTRRSTRSRPRSSGWRSGSSRCARRWRTICARWSPRSRSPRVVERIGDYAKNIAKRVPLIESEQRIEPISILPAMAAMAARDGPRRARRLRRARCRGGGRACASATRRSTISTTASSARCVTYMVENPQDDQPGRAPAVRRQEPRADRRSRHQRRRDGLFRRDRHPDGRPRPRRHDSRSNADGPRHRCCWSRTMPRSPNCSIWHFKREDFEVAPDPRRRGGAAARAREGARHRPARLDGRGAVGDRGLPPPAPHARDRRTCRSSC